MNKQTIITALLALVAMASLTRWFTDWWSTSW